MFSSVKSMPRVAAETRNDAYSFYKHIRCPVARAILTRRIVFIASLNAKKRFPRECLRLWRLDPSWNIHELVANDTPTRPLPPITFCATTSFVSNDDVRYTQKHRTRHQTVHSVFLFCGSFVCCLVSAVAHENRNLVHISITDLSRGSRQSAHLQPQRSFIRYLLIKHTNASPYTRHALHLHQELRGLQSPPFYQSKRQTPTDDQDVSVCQIASLAP